MSIFCILSSTTMKALAQGKMSSIVMEGGNEILFPIVALECVVRLPFAPIVRQFPSELPFYPLQAPMALWKKPLALCVIWHRAHRQDPSMVDL